MKIAQKIQNLRERAGITQKTLAELSGLPLPTVRGIEQGQRLPSWPTLQKIAEALGANLGDFQGLEHEPPPKKKR